MPSDDLKREQKIAEFESEVNKRIRVLQASKDDKARLDAARWLGEAGEPKAITALRNAYKTDQDAKVRDAARYSLGMFRSLQQALKEDPDGVVEMLEAVQIEGKFGRRGALSGKSLLRLLIALLISALLVGAASFVLPPILRQALSGSASVAPAPTAVSNAAGENDLRTRVTDTLAQLEGQVTQLQSQYSAAAAAGTVDCALAWSNPLPVSVSAESQQSEADLAALATELNGLIGQYQQARQAYNRACGSTPEAVQSAEFSASLQSLDTLLQALQSIRTRLSGETTPVTPTPETPATLEATAPSVVEPTVDEAAARHIRLLNEIISDMTELRGAYSRLNQYWIEAQRTPGSGCGDPVSAADIPADYTIPQAEADANPSLKLAVDLVNQGLSALRQSQTLLEGACQTRTTTNSAAQGIQLTTAAKTAFDTALTALGQTP